MSKIAFIGIGKVGFALADNLQKRGYDVIIGNNNPDSESVVNALAQNQYLIEQPVQQAIHVAEMIFLTVPFKAVRSVVTSYDFTGKIIVDCTNPVGPGMTHGLESKMSGSEMIRQYVPGVPIVKAFTVYGFENLIDTIYPGYSNIKPAMFIAGDDEYAKQSVSRLCEELGWESVDTGKLSQSLHLEHLTLLWINMARLQGKGSDFVWAKLKR
ncbi:MAG: NADPH-dependent F420 reductase [Cyclobacteriaceae bacterium]